MAAVKVSRVTQSHAPVNLGQQRHQPPAPLTGYAADALATVRQRTQRLEGGCHGAFVVAQTRPPGRRSLGDCTAGRRGGALLLE